MEVSKLKEILKTEYGIKDEKEFDAAVSNSAGINLGIFTIPLVERSRVCEQKAEAKAEAQCKSYGGLRSGALPSNRCYVVGK